MMRTVMRRAATASAGRRFVSMEEQIAAAYNDTQSGAGDMPERKLTQLQFSIPMQASGALLKALQIFADRGINFTSITTRQAPDQHKLSATTVFADINAHIDDPNVKEAMAELKGVTIHTQVVQSCTIPWYATHISDIDKFKTETLAAGGELTSDHPGFNDVEYRERRDLIATKAKTFSFGDKVPRVSYTKGENKTWGLVWDKLMDLYPTHACKEYQYNFSLMVENCGYRPDQIPELEVRIARTQSLARRNPLIPFHLHTGHLAVPEVPHRLQHQARDRSSVSQGLP